MNAIIVKKKARPKMSDMIDKLLKAQGDELSWMLGEVLINEDKAHEPNLPGHMCKRCFISFRWPDSPAKDADCPSKNFISLDDWNVAMKWRDWAVKEYGKVVYKDALVDIFCHEQGITDDLVSLEDALDGLDRFVAWIAVHAQPEHYLKAAAICKLKGKL